MRSILRFICLCGILIATIILIDVLAFSSIFSSGEKFKSTLRQGNVYEALAKSINDKMEKSAADSGDAVPFTLTGQQLTLIVEPILDQAFPYILGQTPTPPTITLTEIAAKLGGNSNGLMTELTQMQKEFTSQVANDDIANQLPPEQKAALNSMKKVAADGGKISLETQLLPLRKLFGLAGILIPATIFWISLNIVLILLFSTDNKNRASWIAGSGFFLAILFGFGTIIFSLPNQILPSIIADMNAQGSTLGPIFIQSFATPLFDVLFRYHLATTAIVGMIGIIALLARLMLFGTPTTAPSAPVKKQPQKTKK